MKTIITTILIILLSFVNASAQTCDLRFVVELNNGTNFDVKIQIQGSVQFGLGTSNIVINFNDSDLSSPSLLNAHNFSGGDYQVMTVTNPQAGVASINIELNNTNNGTVVNTSWTDVATIRFNTLNAGGSSDLSFRTSSPETIIFDDDEITIIGQGNWIPLNTTPLPVELVLFTANVIANNVILNWKTETEINNYGFEIQRSSSNDGSVLLYTDWEKIDFVEGYGNSNSQKTYSYTDKNVKYGRYAYRLKQIDIDGSFEYSPTVDADIGKPEYYWLGQNFPNPFNPVTTISYTLPAGDFVTIKIFNIQGQIIKTLVNEIQDAGYYEINFDGSELTSGVYIYRMETKHFGDSKKLLLLK